MTMEGGGIGPTHRKEEMDRGDSIDMARMVLEAVANDYEQFDVIVSYLSEMALIPTDRLDAEQIKLFLRKSIGHDHVRVYLLYERPPHVVSVAAHDLDFARDWFYITPEGKQHLQSMEKAGILNQGGADGK